MPATYFGRTTLQAATEKGHRRLVEYLLTVREGITMSKEQHTPCLGGRTALQVAASNGDLELVELFLGKGAGIGERQAKIAGRTALQAAAENGHLHIVKRLVGYDKSMTDAGPSENYGRTALQAAAEGGHLAVVEFLLKAGVAKPFSPGSKYYGRTALQAAAGGGILAILNMLLELANLSDVDADYEIVDKIAKNDGRNTIQAGAKGGHLEIVNRLLKLIIDLEGWVLHRECLVGSPAWNDGTWATEAAAAIGREDLCKLLCNVEITRYYINDMNGPFRRALQALSKAGYLHIYELFRDRYPQDIRAPGVLPLLVSGGHIAIIDLFMREGGWYCQDDIDGALRCASERGSVPLVDLILFQSGARFSQEAISCAINAAAGGNHLTLIDRLSEFDGSIDTDLTTAFRTAAQKGHLSMCERLIERGVDINHEATQTLTAAAGCGRLDILRYLVEKLKKGKGTAVDIHDALSAAARIGHLAAVDYLLQHGADVNHIGSYIMKFTTIKIYGKPYTTSSTPITSTALGLASSYGHFSVVERLVGKGAHVNIPEGASNIETPHISALHEAAKNGYLDIVDCLLKNGAKVDEDIDLPDQYRGLSGRLKSPLRLAAWAGHYLVVRRLLQAGADVKRYKSDRTPLVFACKGGHLAAAKELLEGGAPVDEIALEAAKRDSPRMVQLLQSYELHQDSTDVEGKGPADVENQGSTGVKDN